MKHAYIFPGQGAQFTGMAKDLFDNYEKAKEIFAKANEILGFDIAQIMFEGSADDLKATRVTQPAIFLHSIIQYYCVEHSVPQMVAGHSLGEFSALVANGCLHWEDALRLVAIRANAMQAACEKTPSTMAAILGLDDAIVETICDTIAEHTVVAANYNCPGQLVISGSLQGIAIACEKLKEAGAKRALPLPVGGAFHSPLMEPAREQLKAAIENTIFAEPICPVYQNVDAQPYTDPEIIKSNLIAQLTGAVRWTQSVQNMVMNGASRFTEVGPGKVLQGLVQKIAKDVTTDSL